ncbi:MAG: DNA replication and repair protein RecF [Acidobacteriota bacterium]|nr:DNA replication and repair protein RecF [Acidobacteriota bacterium]MDE3043636.1 DNA replication and repair protein RecF [Acidobacteriota bacterium]
MGLHELQLRDFRLFEELRIEPDPTAVTVFLSANGTGKTSVLEAVATLATANSFRTTTASDLIRNTAPLAEVHGVLFQRERRVQIDLTLTRNARNTTKKMLVNGVRPSSRADLGAVLPLTVFTPEGIDIVRAGPEHRRSFLTTLMTDVEHATGEVIERHARVLAQRNALLRTLEGRAPLGHQQEELGVWTSEFSEISEELISWRMKVLEGLAPLADALYRELSQHPARLELTYEPSWRGDLSDALAASERDDLHRGFTTVGPHRDDVRVTLDGRDVRRQASQGEQRSAALALRLGGHHLVQQWRGVDPLLLLDDVFSELDPLRSDRLLQLLPAGQTLVTTASPLPHTMNPAVIIDLTRRY